MFKFIFLLFTVFCLFLVTFSQLSAQNNQQNTLITANNSKIIKLVGIEWNPYQGQDLPNGGIATEIVVAAFEAQGYTTEITYLPWSRALKELEYGHFNATIAAYITEERHQKFYFSNSYLMSPVVFYKRVTDSIDWPGLTNLKKYIIGTVRGYANSAEFDQATYLKLEEANSNLANLKKLIAKHVDLIVIDKNAARYLINRYMSAFSSDLEAIDPPLVNNNIHVMFSKINPDNQKLLNDFNLGLDKIKNNSRYQQILLKHGFE